MIEKGAAQDAALLCFFAKILPFNIARLNRVPSTVSPQSNAIAHGERVGGFGVVFTMIVKT